MDVTEILEKLWEGQLHSCSFDFESHTAVFVADFNFGGNQFERYTITCGDLRSFWISWPKLFTWDLIELTDLKATRIEIEDEDDKDEPHLSLWELRADFWDPPEGLKITRSSIDFQVQHSSRSHRSQTAPEGRLAFRERGLHHRGGGRPSHSW
jgi:hypothetical protein